MRIPHTIPSYIFQAYKCSLETTLLPQERGRTILSESTDWDARIVPDLKTLALRAITSAWKESPIFEELPSCTDKHVLLETLSTDLPFELLITRISAEYFWQRAARNRWQCNDVAEHGDSWRRLYCERHLSEYLENFEADYLETQREECDKLINLLKDYVCTVRLRRLMPRRKGTGWPEAENGDELYEDRVHHIPLDIILPRLPHLTELYLNFGMIYTNDAFEWRDFEFSIDDCRSLANGLARCDNLKKFSLTRSNLDQPRAAAILHGLAANNNVEQLDFSHCKLSDRGAHAVAEFLSFHGNLKALHLANNNIGPSGVSGLVFGLLKRGETILEHLNLRLNPLEDTGGASICALLLRTGSLVTLNISGCGLTEESGVAMADVLASGHINVPKLTIDLSNNDLGPAAGKALQRAIKSSHLVVGLDSRMCNFLRESVCSINESVSRNKKLAKNGAKPRHIREDQPGASIASHQKTHDAGPGIANDRQFSTFSELSFEEKHAAWIDEAKSENADDQL